MSRYIDIKWLEDNAKEYSLGYYGDDEWATPLNVLDSAPSIDLVRCKECKHQWREHKVCAHEANVVDGVCGKRAEDDDFCSYGERKESE